MNRTCKEGSGGKKASWLGYPNKRTCSKKCRQWISDHPGDDNGQRRKE